MYRYASDPLLPAGGSGRGSRGRRDRDGLVGRGGVNDPHRLSGVDVRSINAAERGPLLGSDDGDVDGAGVRQASDGHAGDATSPSNSGGTDGSSGSNGTTNTSNTATTVGAPLPRGAVSLGTYRGSSVSTPHLTTFRGAGGGLGASTGSNKPRTPNSPMPSFYLGSRRTGAARMTRAGHRRYA